LLGDKLSAEQAAQWGMIWQCVDDAQLPSVVDDIAKQFAAAPTRALARTKQALHASWNRTLDQQLDLERDYQREMGFTADFTEGVAAFNAKRPPKFSGR
jgi:2-(1,2-epoxy-1,2-dihydrophenyl)acetyl-CoA isomerase